MPNITMINRMKMNIRMRMKKISRRIKTNITYSVIVVSMKTTMREMTESMKGVKRFRMSYLNLPLWASLKVVTMAIIRNHSEIFKFKLRSV